jgi:hypothetical protein
MADNVILSAGTSDGITLAADDVAGVHYQRIKVSWGADNSAVDASAANPLPVVQTGTLNVGTVTTVSAVTAITNALPAGTNNIGDVDVLSIAAGDNNIGNVDIASIAAGDNNIGNVDLASSIPAGTNNIGDVDVLTIAAGDNNIGNVDIVTVPTDPFGANADAASATGSISAKLRFIASTGIPITGTVTVGSHAVTNAGTFAVQAGQGAHDSAIAGNPVRVGARAVSADFTAVTTGDTADIISSLLGKQVMLPYALPGQSWSYASPAAVTDTADDTALAAAGAGIRAYITGVQVFNGHDTTGTEVVIKDGSTVLWRGWAEQTGGGCSARFDPPLRGTANTAVNVANITNSSSTYFNLQGYTAAE